MSNFDPSVLPPSVMPAHEGLRQALAIPASARALARSQSISSINTVGSTIQRLRDLNGTIRQAGGRLIQLPESTRQIVLGATQFQLTIGAALSNARVLSEQLKGIKHGLAFSKTAQTQIPKLPSIGVTQHVLSNVTFEHLKEIRAIVLEAAARMHVGVELEQHEQMPHPGTVRADSIFQQIAQADHSFPDPSTILDPPSSSSPSSDRLASIEEVLQHMAVEVSALASAIHRSPGMGARFTAEAVKAVLHGLLIVWVLHIFPALGPPENAIEHTRVATTALEKPSLELLHHIKCEAGSDAYFLRLVERSQTVRKTPKSKAPEAGYIPAGSVVCSLQATKDWTMVSWKQGGEVFSGWVYTRYLSKLMHMK